MTNTFQKVKQQLLFKINYLDIGSVFSLSSFDEFLQIPLTNNNRMNPMRGHIGIYFKSIHKNLGLEIIGLNSDDAILYKKVSNPSI